MRPRYPQIHVRLRTDHPLAMVSAVRHALRRSGVARREIRRFCEQALSRDGTVREICEAWADLKVRA
ncbi:MAG: hypothetical protein D6696_20050 [Acidobacteria bacterium]|nr:MAG: hypothetical protein D6696_20050 [Acidobacteriota bacterium]